MHMHLHKKTKILGLRQKARKGEAISSMRYKTKSKKT